MRWRNGWALLVGIVALAAALAACSPYTPPKNSESSPPLEENNPVIYKNLELKLYVHVLSVRTDRANGLLVAKIALESKKGSDMPIEIKAKWLDKDGFEVKDSWGMRPVMLKRDEITTQEFIAPSPAAESVRFVISTPD
jgi:uncharacterized protein YcfL